MRRLITLLTLLAVLAFPSKARAGGPYEIASEKADFHLTLTPHQWKMCVAWPEGHTDPVGCEGLDVSKFASIGATSKGIVMEGVVLLREDDVTLLVMVMRDSSASFAKLDDNSLDEFARGSMKGMQDKLPGVPMEVVQKHIVRKNGLEMGDVRVEANFAADAPGAAIFTHSRYFQIPADGASFTVVFATGPGGLAKLDSLSDETIATVSARTPKPKSLFDKDDHDDSDKKSSDSGSHSKAFREGEVVGRFMGFAFVIGIIVLVIVAATRRKAQPPPWSGAQGFQPPGGPQHPQGHPGYPPQQPYTSYPPQPGYPPQQPHAGYPPNQPHAGYPPQQPHAGYPPNQPQAGYPQQSYPPQPSSPPAPGLSAPIGQLPPPNPPPFDPSRGSKS